MAFLRGKLITMSTHIRKWERSQINNLIKHLNFLEKYKQGNPKSRLEEIIKNRTEINEMKTKSTKWWTNQTKTWIFEKISKIDKPLAKLIKRRKDEIQINKIRAEKGGYYIDTNEFSEDHMGIFWKTIPQQSGISIRNWKISQHIWLIKIEPRGRY
jgi:hypothetical protein